MQPGASASFPATGVVVYVDVRSEICNEHAGAAIARQLESLGATVERKLSAGVQLVVFKDGYVRTVTRATQLGIPLVSVLWIEQ